MGTHFVVKALIFCLTASTATGTGHLMRCLALAQVAEKAQLPVHFVINAEAKGIALSRHDWVYPITLWPEDAQEHEIVQIVNRVGSQYNNYVVVLDSYNFSLPLAQDIAELSTLLVVIDDGQNTLVSAAHIVVNPVTKRHDEAYKASNSQVICCTGSSYRMMRKEFYDMLWKHDNMRVGVVICIGGSDPRAITPRLLNALESAGMQHPVRVVTGAAVENMAQLNAVFPALSFPCQHIQNCQDMADVWGSAKLAISAAGGSVYELGLCRTPSMLMVIADNQREAAEQCQRQGWAKVFTPSAEPAFFSNLALDVINLLNNQVELDNMQKAIPTDIDAHGAFRVFDKISERYQEVFND